MVNKCQPFGGKLVWKLACSKNNVNPCGTCAKVAKDNDSLLEFDALPIKVKQSTFSDAF